MKHGTLEQYIIRLTQAVNLARKLQRSKGGAK